jgi:1-acyl-sn-glycerol-3-phosphate acyltransferase
MTIDGFTPEAASAFESFRSEQADRVYGWVDRFARRFHVEVIGLEKIPKGGALLVANHAFGWDVMFPMAAIWREQRRPVWALGEHAWWRVPFLRRLAASVGTVDGTQHNADRLLSNGELVLVLPGGLREAVKPSELRYQLLWGHRYGFVRAAIRTGTPIVPLASIGADDVFDFVGDAYRRGERLLGHRGIPIPRPRHFLPIPHFRKLRYVVGDPIPPSARPEDENDPTTLKRVRHEVEGELHELIETELAHRAGIEI